MYSSFRRRHLNRLLGAAALLAMPATAAHADLLTSNRWPMAEAQAALAAEIGDALVHEIDIGSDDVAITADHPSDPEQTTDYYWDGEAVRTGTSMVNFIGMGMGDTAPFPLADLPLDGLPAVKAAAIEAMVEPEARIVDIEGTMPTDRASKKLLALWQVTLSLPDGETGTVLLTSNARVVDVIMPESRQAAAGPWLAPDTVAATLARLGDEFGENARFAEIFIDDSKALIHVEDPQNPGSVAEFLLDPTSVRRMSMPMPSPFAPTLDRAFTLADIAALDADMLGELEQRTLERMGQPNMTVFRYTISRAILFMTPEDDRLLVEVRAEAPDGWTSGRVAYDMAGTEVDSVLP